MAFASEGIPAFWKPRATTGVYQEVIRNFSVKLRLPEDSAQVEAQMNRWESEIRITRHPLIWLGTKLLSAIAIIKKGA